MFAIALWDAVAPPARARARPARQEAARVDEARRRHARVRVRAEGVPRACPVSAPSPISPLSTPISRSATCRARAPGCSACSGSSRARCSSSRAAASTSSATGSRSVEREVASDDEWLERVRDEVTAAVRKRLASDVPLGALLSGGIDSAIVVALMAEASAEPVRTFTVGFADAALRRARVRASRRRPLRDAPRGDRARAGRRGDAARLAAAFDEPLGDEAALPLFLICEAARREVTVALVGDGGDESFAGYERYAAMGLADRVPAPAAARGRAAAARAPVGAARAPLDDVPRSALPRRRRRAARGALRPADAGALARAARRAVDGRRADGDRRARVARAPARRAARQTASPGCRRSTSRTYLPGDLLPKSDIASMAHSLELRSPLLDHRVVELGLALPDRLKQRGREGKIALRRAFADELPRARRGARQVAASACRSPRGSAAS